MLEIGNHLPIKNSKTKKNLFLDELKNGANPNFVLSSDGNKINSLVFCILKKDYEALELLLQYKADPEFKLEIENSSSTPIKYAIYERDLIAVEKMLDARPDLANRSESVFKYAFISKGDISPDIVELLIKHNANPNQIFEDGATPLIISIDKKSLQSIKTLIRLGADVNLPDNIDKGGASPLRWANSSDPINEKIIGFLKERGAQDFLVEEDILILQHEENILALEPKNQSSKTGLHQLAKDGSKGGVSNLLKLLVFWKGSLKENEDPDGKKYIEAFATIKYKSSEGYGIIDDVTPLYIAVNNSNSSGASLLIGCMADPNHKVKKYSDEKKENLEAEYSIFELALDRSIKPLKAGDDEKAKAYKTLDGICKKGKVRAEILKELKDKIIKCCAKDSKIQEILADSFPIEIDSFHLEIDLKKLSISERESEVFDSSKPSSSVGIQGAKSVEDRRGEGVEKS